VSSACCRAPLFTTARRDKAPERGVTATALDPTSALNLYTAWQFGVDPCWSTLRGEVNTRRRDWWL
jgi:hypothetical protein